MFLSHSYHVNISRDDCFSSVPSAEESVREGVTVCDSSTGPSGPFP